MLPRTLIKGFDEGRLKRLLALFFIALALPTAALIWQGYNQLKWESFHQYRGAAEELMSRIDSRLAGMINAADARSFADYGFLIVSGDANAGFVQRSPLSAFPVEEELPGLLGYFQVGTEGEFSTPLLPPPNTDATILGISAEELTNRQTLAAEIQAVLADNELVRSRPEVAMRRGLATEAVEPAVVHIVEEKEQSSDAAAFESRSRQLGDEADALRPAQVTAAASMEEMVLQPESTSGGFADESMLAGEAFDPTAAPSTVPAEEMFAELQADYSQQVFDQLNQPRAYSPASTGKDDNLAASNASTLPEPEKLRKNAIGKVSDIKLDEDLQKKSEDVERDSDPDHAGVGGRVDTPARTKRREQTALPESAPPTRPAAALKLAAPGDIPINTFESEVDPFEFSLLDSGHLVVFRKVWRDGNRFIQGLLLDQDSFIQQTVDSAFIDTNLYDMSNLIVAYQDDVIHSVSGHDTYQLASSPVAMDGALLYRSRLTAPLDSLELIFSIKSLPAGPGASVLGWVTLVLAIVFIGGFVAIYRLGRSQIQLARQQQDFVSAVSHELKTPLTSIRMYGEMLKEGWADEAKRQSYYEFIHDESERLTRMISNVLQLAKITRNEPQFDLQATNVGELMSNIESKISSQVESAGFTMRFKRSQSADQATINIDDDCFAQIIINLVDNAIKFSKNAKDQSIVISSRLGNDGAIAFAVRDHGPGIARGQMKKIFELFYRAENELTRETVGTGIGLAIVHQLTTAMDGKVDVVNKDPGVEFTISFPTA